MDEKGKDIHILADAWVETLRDDYLSELEPFEAYAERMKQKFIRNMNELKSSFQKGYNIIINKLKEQKEDVDHLIIDDNKKKSFEKYQNKKSKDILFLYEVIGYTDKDLQLLIETASKLYDEKRYDESYHL